jgi:hypothetical protein
MILHLASTRIRPLIRMHLGFSCPNNSKFLTIPLPAHPCAPSNLYVPPYIMRAPFPMCAPLAVRALLVEQIPLYSMAPPHWRTSLMDVYAPLQVPFEPLRIHLRPMGVLYIPWSFCAHPRKSERASGLPCTP